MSESTWNDPRITAYVLDELPAEDRQAFEREVESSAELAAAVEEARSVTGQLARLYAAEQTPPLDTQRREAIRTADSAKVDVAGDGKSVSSATNSNRWRVTMTVLAAAAVVILLVGVAPWLNQKKPDLTVTQTVDPPAVELATEATRDEVVATIDPVADGVPEASMVLTDGAGQVADSPEIASGLSSKASSRSRDAIPMGSDGNAGDLKVRGSLTEPGEVQRDSSRAAPPPEYSAKKIGSLFSQSGRAPIPLEKSEGQSLAENAPQPNSPDANVEFSRSAPASRAVLQQEQPREGFRKFSQESEGEMKGINGVPNRYSVDGDSPAAPAPVSSLDLPGISSLADDSDGAVELQKQTRRRSRTAVNGSESEVRLLEDFEELAESEEMVRRSGPVGGGLGPTNEAAPMAADAYGADNLERKPRQLGEVASRTRGRGIGLGFGGRAQGQKMMMMEMEEEFARPIDSGRGPGIGGDQFDPITDNPFRRVSEHPLSTFSVDVDTASYSKVRDFLVRANHLPRPDAVRIEEMVNYFEYDYEAPQADDKHPFAAAATITSCPWNGQHRLARISLKGKTMNKGQRPPCNLVFLLDTSGSMDAPNKLPLVKQGMRMLQKQLREKDRVAITVYAGSAGLVLGSTSAKKEKKIEAALNQLSAGGSTNGGAGIALAYQTARDHFISDGVNRVILCTDGDFNVGTTGTDELVRMVEKEAKGGIYLSVLGFGMGNHNDAMLEQISGRGNGNYAFIDTESEARKVLVDQTSSTLVTIAKNVKMQVEFNPAHVSSYRLIGYENRVLAKEDFNDDKKDAGEIGAGHAVTALYELVPVDVEAVAGAPKVDELKYQTKPQQTAAADSDETMTLKLRYLGPDDIVEQGAESTLVEVPVTDDGGDFEDADTEFRFAAAVAGFGMKLRRSQYAGSWTMSDVLRVAESAGGKDKYELRAEFVDIVRKASELMGEE